MITHMHNNLYWGLIWKAKIGLYVKSIILHPIVHVGTN